MKAMTDYWVVGKKSDQRELYVILNQKNANLIEVNGRSNMDGWMELVSLSSSHMFSWLCLLIPTLFFFSTNRGSEEALCDTVQQHFLLGLKEIKKRKNCTKKRERR